MLKNLTLDEKQKSIRHISALGICKSMGLATALLLSQTIQAASLSVAEAAALYQPETTYSIYRKGKNIGQHTLQFNTMNNGVDVTIESRITVRVMRVPVFRFNYVSKEVWEGEQLLSVRSTTKTNKKVERASLSTRGNISRLKSDDKQTEVEVIKHASNHWYKNAVEETRLFNTIKGTLSNVSVEKIDKQTVKIGDIDIAATHYIYSGDLAAEAWYDNNGRWIKLAFLGSDGSKITYLIDNP